MAFTPGFGLLKGTSMYRPITAAMLYDYVRCPHRVSQDLFGDPSKRDEISAFVQLLWDRGHDHEQQVIQRLSIPFTDLSRLSGKAKEAVTQEAMARGDELIYQGRISTEDLLGEPDLIRKQDDGYVAGDIKSGTGLEGAGDNSNGKPKKHYAVQLSLYTDILDRLGVSAARTAFVWDIHGQEVIYELSVPQGSRSPQTLWSLYQQILQDVRDIVSEATQTRPAMASDCKLCHWRSVCSQQVKKTGDLTLIPQLGRSKRDVLASKIPTIKAMAEADVETFVHGNKTIFPRIGITTLEKFQIRARLLTEPNAKPLVTAPIHLPDASTELFFDIETDPMRDICYLHGFVERHNGDNQSEQFHAFVANAATKEQEEKAFADAWAYVQSCQPCIIYYYSKYERTWWRKLRAQYPHVAAEQDIESMFDPGVCIDLYGDVIQGHIEWPTNDYSVKTLAQYLGFQWRDTEPSGAASIEWYHSWVKSGDPKIRQRILDYNEDDCVAMRVLLDGIRELT
jgi:predicted RecB family nuclease